MSTFEVNLRLDVKNKSSTPAEIELRRKTALAYLRRQGPVRYLVRDFAFGRIKVLIAEVAAETWKEKSIYRLALKIDQDCISVYSPTRKFGALIGPGNSTWGAFKLTRFRRYDSDLDVREINHFDPYEDVNEDQVAHDERMSRRKPLKSDSKARLEALLREKEASDPGNYMSVVDWAVKNHPGLTREKAQEMMDDFGF